MKAHLLSGQRNGNGLGKGGLKMKKLKFYNLRTKRAETTDKYAVKVKKGRTFAVATGKGGTPMWRIMGKAK